MLTLSSVLALFAAALLIFAEPKNDLFIAIQEQSPELLKLQGEALQLEFQNETPLDPQMKNAQSQMRQIFQETKKPRWILQIELINIGDGEGDLITSPALGTKSASKLEPLLIQISLISAKTRNKKAEYGIKLESKESANPHSNPN